MLMFDRRRYDYLEDQVEFDKNYEVRKEFIEEHSDRMTLLPNGWEVPKSGHWDMFEMERYMKLRDQVYRAFQALDAVDMTLRERCPYIRGKEDVWTAIKSIEELYKKVDKIYQEGRVELREKLKKSKED